MKKHLHSRLFALVFLLYSIWGWGQTTVTISIGTTGITSNSYDGGAERTWLQNSINFGGKSILKANSPNNGKIQFEKGKGVIYNIAEVPGIIQKIEVIKSDSESFSLFGGNSSRLVNDITANYSVGGTLETSFSSNSFTTSDLSSKNYTFFAIKKGGTGTGYITSIKITYLLATTWDATNSWTNGTPDATKNVIIDGTYDGAGFVAKDVTVNSGKSLTIATGSIETPAVVNNGSIIVKDGANFIHNAYSGTGSFSLEKNTTSNADKYVFWSSPVAGQNMYNLYATASPFVMTYNTTTDYYNTVVNPTIGAFGTGYSVKVPANNAPATFTGTPNLGNQTVTLINTANANGNAYNLIGNPYPANLDLANFYIVNTTNVGETFYFWVPNVGDNTQNGATATVNPGWAVYNANTTTWSRAASGSNSIIRPGQAFIVKGLTTGALFNNDMRTSSNTGVSFFNKNTNSNSEGKYWLQLSLPNQSAYQMAVTYSAGASNNLDASDSKMMSVGNDALYSTVGGEKLAIQGRGSFVNTDVVILGNKHAQNGNYAISLVGKEGLFNNGQAIYLRDKQNGTYTDLSVQDYNFTATAGELTNRFEIVYLPQSSLATTELVKEELKVYKDQEVFIVENTAKIKKITVYDANGRLVKTLTPNANKAVIEGLTKGMYLLNIETQGKVITKKIVK